MSVDLKAATPDTSVPAGAVLFGADSQSAASPSVYSVEDVAFAFYEITATDTSGLNLGSFRQLDVSPSGASTGIFFARTSKAYYTSTSYDVSGAGHVVGALNWAAHSTTRTISLLIGTESKIDNESTGTVTVAVAHEAQVSSNAGTISTLHLNQARVTDNDGTIGQLNGYYFPDHSAIGGTITARFAFNNRDPEAPLFSLGPIIDQSVTYASPSATGFTVTIPARRQMLLLTPVGAYAAGTINLPAQSTVYDGQSMEITTTQDVTAVTWGANGASFVYNGPSGLTAGQTVRFRYFGAIDWWIRI